jgi:hypothetical protein
MLPVLDKKKIASVLIARRNKSGAREAEQPAEQVSEDLERIAEQIIAAVGAQDAKALARALTDAFQLVDAQPHSEGEHI